MSKSKEMVVTFSNKQRQKVLAAKPIDIVEKYKYLGTIFDNLLKLRRY